MTLEDMEAETKWVEDHWHRFVVLGSGLSDRTTSDAKQAARIAYRQGVRSVTSTRGLKHDHGKPRFSLLPGGRSLTEIARVMQHGVEDCGYPVGNWKEVEPQRYRDALGRHFAAWLEDPVGKDEKSGISHLAHVGACVMILLWFCDDERV